MLALAQVLIPFKTDDWEIIYEDDMECICPTEDRDCTDFWFYIILTLVYYI